MAETLAAMVRAKYPGAYDDLSDTQLETQVRAKFPGVYDDIPLSSAKAQETAGPPAKPSDSGAIPLAVGTKAFPAIADAAYAFGTSPTAAARASSLARNATTLGGVVQGAVTMNPVQVLAAPREGWAAGKGAYWLAKGAQSVARPVAAAMDAAKPIVQDVVGPLSVAQGALDLAQMAEPNRKDIGFLGIGVNGEPADPNHPALLNLLAMKASEAIGSLIKQGLSLGEASRTYWNLKAKTAK